MLHIGWVCRHGRRGHPSSTIQAVRWGAVTAAGSKCEFDNSSARDPRAAGILSEAFRPRFYIRGCVFLSPLHDLSFS